ncbi:MAG: hypothetical protein M1835_008112 [Candelina submexicana]|nr:MAG: hypothetical protein M1835_008112 [Candelina submexicana]
MYGDTLEIGMGTLISATAAYKFGNRGNKVRRDGTTAREATHDEQHRGRKWQDNHTGHALRGLIISICWNAFNILFFCRADIPIRPAANGVMDLLIWILLVSLNVYALICTNRYGFSRSTSQASVPSANKYGGAVGSAFVWLAALLHSIMFIQAFLEARRLKRRTATTIPDATDLEDAAQRAAQKAQRVSLAKIWLRAATVVVSTSGFICFVAAIALNNNWYAIALNIEYWSQGQDTSHLTVALAADYYPLAPVSYIFIPPKSPPSLTSPFLPKAPDN